MSHSPNISEDGLNGLLDHAKAQADSIARLELMVWYATDVLLEADAIFRRYGPPPAPNPELTALLDGVREFLLKCPVIDPGAHNHPLPERPTTPGGVGEGEDPAPPGPASGGIDVGAALEIGDPFAGLDVTDDIDGRDAA